MSCYYATAINPRTGKEERAFFIDDYFGRHKYGVKFDGEDEVHREKDIRFPPAPIVEDRIPEGLEKP